MKWFDESKIKYIILSVIILLELMIISLEVMCTKCDEENNTINEIIIKNSRFICLLYKVDTNLEINNYLLNRKELKNENKILLSGRGS